MLQRKFIFYVLLLLACGSRHAAAQITVKYDTAQPDNQTVVLHNDPRLALLTGYKDPSRVSSAGSASGSIRYTHGFRVQIYCGTDRNKANAVKTDFMRRYPRTRAYMTYILPQYRIKVGDYATRQEAQQFYNQLTSIYSPCMVVGEIVEINTFRKNEDANTK
jgi:hypothetical protein